MSTMKRCDVEKIRNIPPIILLKSGQTGYSHRFQAPLVNITFWGSSDVVLIHIDYVLDNIHACCLLTSSKRNLL